MDVGGALTRKIGPLPVWAWGGVVGGSLLAYRALTGSGGGGAVSSAVTPVGGGLADPSEGSGGGGASAETPTPWYAVIPGVGTIIDRPPGEVTIIKPPPTTTPTPTPTPIAKLIATIRGDGRGAIYNSKGERIGYVSAGSREVAATKTRIKGVDYYRILSGKWAGKYLRAGSTAFTFKPFTSGTGDTLAYAEGDSGTPLTPRALVPAAPVLPLGNIVATPTLAVGVFRGYSGPTIDADVPIPSAARIALPPISGGAGSASLRPALPPGIDKPKPPANRSRWTRPLPRFTIDPIERIFAPVVLAADGQSSRLKGTTARLPLPLAQTVRNAAATRAGRNISG